MLKRYLAGILSMVMVATGIVVPVFTKDIEGSTDFYRGWNLVWSDEFEGTELNRNNWNVEVNGYGGWNNELQYYCDSSENINVSNGTLKLTALKKSYMDKKYTSARLNSQGKAEFRFGRIEAKMKLPSFKGAWPAFWMLGANGLMWPGCGEIDILETINDESIAYGTAHWQSGDSYESSGSSTWSAGTKLDITKWHTYGIEWDEKQIVWYVDDIKYFALDIASDKNMSSLSLDQYLLLNLAIGGDWPGFEIDDTAFPATMEVDYVRVYEKDSSVGEIPTITVKNDLVESYSGVWNYQLGAWAGVYGSTVLGRNPQEGFTAKLTSVGTDMWGAQASLANLSYTAGNTYTFRCTMTSDIDKNIFVKVEGDNYAELSADYVRLKAGQPYTYEKTVFIPNSYTGNVSLFYAFGGGVNGEAIDSAKAMEFSVSDVSFYTHTTMQDPSYTEPTTAEENTTEEQTTEAETQAQVTDVKLAINGYQVSTTAEGFRTIYTVDDAANEVVSSGMLYGLGDIADSDFVVGSTNNTVYNFDSTELGLMDVTQGIEDTSKSYAMTMRFVKTAEFYNAKISFRAYAKLKDGTYVYSKQESCTIYELSHYLYQNQIMSNYSGHQYLYDNILKVVNPFYEVKEYNWNASVVKPN